MHSLFSTILAIFVYSSMAIAASNCPYPPANFQVYAQPLGQYLAPGGIFAYFSTGPGDFTYSLKDNANLTVVAIASKKKKDQHIIGYYASSDYGTTVERVLFGYGTAIICRLTAGSGPAPTSAPFCDLICRDPSAGNHQNGSSVNTRNSNQWYLGSPTDCTKGEFCGDKVIKVKAIFNATQT